MTSALILDLDGVLITTPSWQSDILHVDGYSEFNQDCVDNFIVLLDWIGNDIQLWLSSSRRATKTKKEFDEIFFNRGIRKALSGFLPIRETKMKRCDEIKAFLAEKHFDYYIILDDDSSLEGLNETQRKSWIRTYPLVGFDSSKLNEARELIHEWKSI
ncbi:MAG: HAD domain-containing protein [Bacteroidota bacterium]